MEPEIIDTEVYSFRNTSKVLDPIRLNKQCLEAYQILKCLLNPFPTGAWRNHPAVLQWKGHEWALYKYAMDMCDEHIFRGGKTKVVDLLKQLNIPTLNKTLPKWIGTQEIHRSHRSRLLFKGRVDASIKTLKTRYLSKGYNVKEFLEKAALPKQNVFTKLDIQILEELLRRNNVIIEQNYYTQFGWEEPDDIPYVWPITKKTISEQEKEFAEMVHKLVEKNIDKIRELI